MRTCKQCQRIRILQERLVMIRLPHHMTRQKQLIIAHVEQHGYLRCHRLIRGICAAQHHKRVLVHELHQYRKFFFFKVRKVVHVKCKM
jgi:hypothetical protein